MNPNTYTTELLSELYYRNSRNVAYADSDIYKLAPAPFSYSITDKKIIGTQIINSEVLKQLREKYGDN
jgi:hypothetical protein